MHELHGRVIIARGHGHRGAQDACSPTALARGDRGHGTEHDEPDTRIVRVPLGGQPLDFRLVRGEGEPGVGAQQRVLVQGDRVIGPGTVDHGAGHQDDTGHLSVGSGGEQAAHDLDVEARRLQPIAARVECRDEVRNDVNSLEHGRHVVGTEIALPEIGPQIGRQRLRIDADDADFPGARRQSGRQPRADRAGHSGNGHDKRPRRPRGARLAAPDGSWFDMTHAGTPR